MWKSLLFTSILIVIIFLTVFFRSTEGFSATFEKSPPSIQSLQELNLGDHRTMVQIQKGDSGKTVLLLHNTPMNLNIWQPLFQTMQRINMAGNKTPTLVAYDLRGHGTAWIPVDPKFNDSNVNNSAWSIEQYLNDCKQVYDQIIGGNEKIIICGFGLGGIIGQKFALTFPELVEKLALLQTSIRPMPSIQEAIDYLSGPKGWIARNPGVTYLTPEEEHIQRVMCEWFHLPHCITDGTTPITEITIAVEESGENDSDAPQYSLAEKMWRQSSSTTNLQALKLLANTDLEPEWESAKDLPFKVHILTATNDPMAPPDRITETYTAIYNTNRQMVVAMDIVDGKHGFTIMRPDYIAGILCEGCLQPRNTTVSDEKGF